MKVFVIYFYFLAAVNLSADTGKPTNREDALRLQIFLDEQLFGPGFLDGKPGKFTQEAVYAYNRSRGRREDDWGAVLADAKKSVKEVYATAVVPRIAVKYIDRKLSSKRENQAKRKDMPYRSYLEYMAERYHTSEGFLIELNGSKKAYGARPRSTLKVPNIAPFLIEKQLAGRSHKEEAELSKRVVVVDTKKRQLAVYEKKGVTLKSGEVKTTDQKGMGFLVATFPITPGKKQFIHKGEWAIKNCIELPMWRYDKDLLKKGKYSKKALHIPPGPNNPVGILWAGLTKKGIGIHGTSSPRTIGRSESAGCIRLANWDAARFPTVVRPGAKVIVK